METLFQTSMKATKSLLYVFGEPSRTFYLTSSMLKWTALLALLFFFSIQGIAQTYAPFPYYTGFEAGSFDASWTTQWNAMLLSINVKNLFDKEYAVSGFSERNGHFPGEPREVVVQVSYDF